LSTTRPFDEAPDGPTIEDLAQLDLRVGRILEAAPLAGARTPSYRMRIDFGAEGERFSSARITNCYPDPSALVGRLVVAVMNLPPRRVAGFESQVLVLGALGDGDAVRLLSVDRGAEPGQRIA
jgi:tRNA-binding protein